MSVYTKYVYWLDEPEFDEVHAYLNEQGIKPRKASKAVCLPLASRLKAGYVPADAWGNYELCRRQMSWQPLSPQAGKILLVTSDPLPERRADWVITERRDFKPPSLPDDGGIQALCSQESYQEAKPEAWEDLAGEDPKMLDRWLKTMGLRNVRFEDLFEIHRANHANFIEPMFYLSQNGEKVPYSIAGTKKVCSACMQLFGIIGGQWDHKLVVPCPGAVIFAGMAPNRYYEVARGE